LINDDWISLDLSFCYFLSIEASTLFDHPSEVNSQSVAGGATGFHHHHKGSSLNNNLKSRKYKHDLDQQLIQLMQLSETSSPRGHISQEAEAADH